MPVEKATDYRNLSRLVMSHFKPGAVTNNFMGKSDYVSEIENGTLYYEAFPGGLLIFRKRQGFYRLNYSVSDSACFPRLPEDAAFVTEHVFRPDAPAEIPEFLHAAGFRPLISRVRLARAPGDAGQADGARFADVRDAAQVDALLRACFDARTGCLPEWQELMHDLENQTIVCAEDDNGNVAGVLHFRVEKGASELRHLAVAETMRRRGVAGQLFSRYIRAIPDRKGLVWVRSDNAPALAFYTKCGYRPDGWTSAVLEKGTDTNGKID